MIKILSTNEMIHDLLTDQYASWTYNEAEAIINYYQDLEEGTGDLIEFDHVAIRCDWTCATEEEAREMYDIEGDVREYLDDHGYCMEVSDQFLFLNF